MDPLFRMYVDEVGNADENTVSEAHNRYLSLTGVIINLKHASSVVYPAIEKLKEEYFDSSYSKNVILHRKEMVNKKPPFDCLSDPSVERFFNKRFLSILDDLNYKVVTVVIDKLDHYQRYQLWRFEPYHYCMSVIVERYILYLQNINATGDVMAECRGKQQDRKLQLEYSRLFEYGTEYVGSNIFSARLTTSDLKMSLKNDNVSGLQIADVIAHPSYRDILAAHSQEPPPTTFGSQVVAILQNSKYLRNSKGETEGYGRKWLP